MAASYSAFLSTKYYSPVFNTALFDGPFRIYFAQAYEGSALKIYHLLQVQHLPVWDHFKKWSEKTKLHVFILIYPTGEDVAIAFDIDPNLVKEQVHSAPWEEGRLMALAHPQTDEGFVATYQSLVKELERLMNSDCQIPSVDVTI